MGRRLLPKLEFSNLPPDLDQHLLDRFRKRLIDVGDANKLATWVASEPIVPDGDWFKDFGSFKFAGCGCYPKTILSAHMSPWGTEVF